MKRKTISITSPSPVEIIKKTKVEVKHEESENEEEFEEFNQNDYKLSELEIKRRENMKKNLELFEEFQINQAKHEVKEHSKSKLPVVGLKNTKRIKKPQELLPRRSSLRIQKIAAETIIQYKEPTYTYFHSSAHDYRTRKAETIKMVDDNNNKDKEDKEDDDGPSSDLSQVIKAWKDEEQTIDSDAKQPMEFSKYSKTINSLTVTSCGKVGKSRICSAAVHPTVNKTIAAFGDKEGHIGIWDVGSDIKCTGYPASEEVLLFEPHCSPIQCMKFKSHNCNQLVTCSYDGTLRQGDFVAQKFTQIFAFDDEDVRLYYFSNPCSKPNTFLTSTSQGTIALIDENSGKLEQSYNLFNNKNAKCVDCHPMNENIFTAVGADGTCGTWDLRKMNSKDITHPISSFKASKTGSSAFFSPGSGNKLLYTSYDNYVRIFDVQSDGTFASKASWSISHDNHTGRWLTTFRATWDPKAEDSFVIGSMGHPRKLDVYGCLENKRVEWIRLLDNDFTTVGSINAFHPTKNILVTGNASGKAYIWS